MTTKQRIIKLEKSRSTTWAQETPDCKFTHEVREEGDCFFIDSLKVDVATYAIEHAEYMLLYADSKIPNELIIYCNGQDNPKGSITIADSDGEP